MTEFHCTFIRHGKTPGNKENLYVGRTDESLLPEEWERLKTEPVPEADRILVSPMKRCRETAEILFPHREKEIVPEFREMDFGIAEYRSYNEMKDFDWYRKFLEDEDAGLPEGESKTEFAQRVGSGLKVLEGNTRDTAVVIHGGSIMALMHTLTGYEKNLYDWMPKNGKGWQGTIRWEEEKGFSIHDIRPFPDCEE